MQNPTIPMSPEDLPQQRIHAVNSLPPRPDGLVFQDSDRAPRPKAIERAQLTHSDWLLCQVEWAWSPMHNAINTYYFNPRPTHWLLWNRWFDENTGAGQWSWYLEGWAPRLKGVDDSVAAIHILADLWRIERDTRDLDHFHWANDAGALGIPDLMAIAREVWPEEDADDEDDEE